jgi:exonuclease SbcC
VFEIEEKQAEKDTLAIKLHQLDEALSNYTAQVKISDSILKDAKENIQRLDSLEQKFKAYGLYTKATHRDGVPYTLISEILPQIENQANDILSYLVDFKIILDTDGKSINIYITYDDDRTWALELASGMERFISAIAIRNALINYSNLPRPNFIAIDEGFGVLDGENMSALYNIFQYLKTQYKFILIISHIDALKDMAENQIEIYKNGGFSKVFF